MADEDEEISLGGLFDDDGWEPDLNYQDRKEINSLRGSITPEELTELIEDDPVDLLEGLGSTFFLSTKTESEVTDDSRAEVLTKFLESQPSPYIDTVSLSSISSLLSEELPVKDAVEQMSKNFSSGVCLEPPKFHRDEEKSTKVSRQILGCYEGTARVFSGSGELFPVGHRSERSYLITWPKACAVLTFLGWD